MDFICVGERILHQIRQFFKYQTKDQGRIKVVISRSQGETLNDFLYSQTCSVIQPRCLTSIPGCMIFISSFTLGKRLAMLACMVLYQDWAMAGSFARRNMELFLVDETTSKYLTRGQRRQITYIQPSVKLRQIRGPDGKLFLRWSQHLCYLFSVSGGHCFRDTWHIFRGMLRGSFTSAGKGSEVLWGEEGGESHGRAPAGEPELLKKADISLMYFTALEKEGESKSGKHETEVLCKSHLSKSCQIKQYFDSLYIYFSMLPFFFLSITAVLSLTWPLNVYTHRPTHTHTNARTLYGLGSGNPLQD